MRERMFGVSITSDKLEGEFSINYPLHICLVDEGVISQEALDKVAEHILGLQILFCTLLTRGAIGKFSEHDLIEYVQDIVWVLDKWSSRAGIK